MSTFTRLIRIVKNCTPLLLKGDFAGLRIRLENWLTQRRAQQPLNVRAGDKITILTTKHTIFVAHLICHELAQAGYSTEIITDIPRGGFSRDLHFVICPQMFKRLPRLYFAFQMEQSVSSRWFDENYVDKLFRAVAVLDYSKQNIAYLQSRGLPYSRTYYCPIGYFQDYASHIGVDMDRNIAAGKKYDIVFYGDTRNPRRAKILEELSRHFSLLIINNVFSVDLYKQLADTRVVVNLHYYENALLETTRIFECLSLGLPVISEMGADHEEHQALWDIVKFVEVDDIAGMLDAIRKTLAEQGSMPKVNTGVVAANNTFPFYLNRLLLAHDLIDFTYFDKRFCEPFDTNSAQVKCLTLTETVQRRSHFASTYGSDFELLEGLRHRIGWIGCALSYKFYARRALRSETPMLVMCEDDVVLSKDFKIRLRHILDYLKCRSDAWDLFSGFIAHLKKDVEILGIETAGDTEFITLNRMTSTVFNVYAPRSLQQLASWDDKFRNANINTIDRYLENSDLKVVTTFPFFAGHEQTLTSTIWGFVNTEYTELIDESALELRQKLNDYKLHRKDVLPQ